MTDKALRALIMNLIERVGEHCWRRDGVCRHDSGAAFSLPCPIERLLRQIAEGPTSGVLE